MIASEPISRASTIAIRYRYMTAHPIRIKINGDRCSDEIDRVSERRLIAMKWSSPAPPSHPPATVYRLNRFTGGGSDDSALVGRYGFIIRTRLPSSSTPLSIVSKSDQVILQRSIEYLGCSKVVRPNSIIGAYDANDQPTVNHSRGEFAVLFKKVRKEANRFAGDERKTLIGPIL